MIESRDIGISLMAFGLGILLMVLILGHFETRLTKAINEKWEKEAIMLNYGYYDNVDGHPVFTWREE